MNYFDYDLSFINDVVNDSTQRKYPDYVNKLIDKSNITSPSLIE